MKKNLEYLCEWKKLSCDENSSSFENSNDITSKTYKCKHVCDGYDVYCPSYISKAMIANMS